jgi:hypothetical protein
MRAAGLAAALVTAFALVATSASAHVPRSFFGIVDGTTLDKADFQRMHKAHVGALRLPIFWPAVQTTEGGPIYWGDVEHLVGRAASHHISVLPTLDGTPRYESHGCSSSKCIRHIHLKTKAQRRNWTSFVKAAVQRYGPHGGFWSDHPGVPYHPVHRWQIWNEESNPKQHNSTKLFSKLVRLSDKAIASVDPHGRLILGGLPGTTHGQSANNAWNYLKGVYKHAGKKHFAGVALHPYSPSVSGVGTQVRKLRRMMRKRHDASTPLLIDEIGWGSGGKAHHGTGSRGQAFVVSPKQQKQRLKASYKLLRRHRRAWNVGGVYWYQWKDPKNAPPGLCAFCYSSGLYKANGRTAKPALAAYRRLAAKAR